MGVRLGVYGHLLPNSVLYKSGTGETFGVVQKFLDQSALVALLALAGAFLLRRRGLLLVVPTVVYLAGSLGTKDSANAFSRFFMPVWPQVALVAGVALVAVVGIAARTARSRALGAVALTAVVAGATTLVLPGSLRHVDRWQERYMGCRVAAREEVADWLRSSTPPDTLFAISDAGYVPARAGGRPAVDNFMLNDPLIQETGPLTSAERADIVHERRPDVLVLGSREPDRFDPVYPTDRRIGTHPEAAGFVLRHVGSGTVPCAYHLMVLERL